MRNLEGISENLRDQSFHFFSYFRIKVSKKLIGKQVKNKFVINILNI